MTEIIILIILIPIMVLICVAFGWFLAQVANRINDGDE